ncbi:MAG: protein-(glutamine-N5) methyltransferase, release factor-specific [Methylotenera sp. 24-45-7]|jgi:release factor glutamine methyltransferase|nr:MAG: protein-(glutamine-N5) methyltransferase, release factor-specific [Mehylophilales bacterium 35-46-6]OYZ41581.1 MAG: protein-(glutamine-N5) methyltransferase, release factor-specific [Methylotenera sp. 24-45-7]OZA08595.1 MAG: protein-(glutamine-N5) methyltransferase, release factor-specific [Methylotenera sp. 17-45-7]OZA54618.1 MAG: protein-(glutamine-N5) methyltransferase, release factor-specific [Methylophilales bacterium 39-45-7]HQS36652.1 peptide chain release factor N(5)-glutamine m
MKIAHALASAQAVLANVSNSGEAKLDAQLLLQHTLNVNRAWLIAHENENLVPEKLAEFNSLIERRAKGVPIAYILGEREFYGLNFMVTPDTLIPRADTETLVEIALAKIAVDKVITNTSFRSMSESSVFQADNYKTLDSDIRRNDGVTVLDLGTGSGAIAMAIAKHRPQAQVIAVDASQAALAVAQRNAEHLQISNVQFLLSDWFSALEQVRFDVIVSNPPYIEQDDTHLTQGDLRFEPISALASGQDGLDDIRTIIDDCLVHLKPQGWLMLEHGYNQAQAVADLMAQIGLLNVETIKDFGGNDRVTIGKNPLIVSTHWQ